MTGKNRAHSKFPSAIRPMLALPAGEPFDRKDWVFEVKWDGVRAVLLRNRRSGLLSIRSRNGNDVTSRYPEIVRVVESAVHCAGSAVLDGEIVVLDDKGRPDFQRHQRRMNVGSAREIAALSKSSPATYYVFDIIYLDGRSLEQLDFVDRRKVLERVVHDPSGTIRISEYIEEKGRATFDGATRLGLEGIVAKYKFSKYLQGARSSWWLKVKRVLTQDCAVVGYTRGEGNRQGYFGSLILAAMLGGKLRFVGHTGSGFGYDQLAEALELMQPLRVDDCPIENIPYVNRPAVWLKPRLVAEVRLNGWTADMIMRAPIFVRFRDDKGPEECIIESALQSARTGPASAPTAKLAPKFSNLDKVFWPATYDRQALAKQDLIDYYSSISDYILPYLRNRPLSLSRYPDGIAGKSFFHKNWEADAPDFVRIVPVYSESRGGAINYIVCNNRETLLWLANLGCIEMHPWYSQVHDFVACSRQAAGESPRDADGPDECGLSTPDYIVFDLDPYIYSGKEAGAEPEYSERGFAATVEVGLKLHELLEGMGIKSYAKTSGRTGLHIMVPVAPIYSFEQTREFARLIGKILQDKSPGQITMQWSTSERNGKVFFDYNQNARGKTVASIFSARPTGSATVSMPVRWDRLKEIRPLDFTITNTPAILQDSGDPWAGILDNRQDIGELLSKATGSSLAAGRRPGRG